MKLSKKLLLGSAIAAGCVAFGQGDASASSHREAPFVTRHPKVDSTDFYMFNSPSQAGFVTILADYQPFQENFGGPNYYELDPDALYEISIDNNGDGKEDVTFQFNFHHALANGGAGLNLSTFTGAGGAGAGANPGMNGVPLINIGGIAAGDTSAAGTGNLNVLESYDLNVVGGDRRTGTSTNAFMAQTKPVDFIGTATFGSAAAYEAYAQSFKKTFTMPSSLPGCSGTATAWVGQRREPFAGNIGPIFDLIQGPYKTSSGAINPTQIAGTITGGGDRAGRGYDAANPFNTGLLYTKNITTLALEIPTACLVGNNTTGASAGIIGGWTSASLHQARVLNPGASYTVPSKEGGAWTQVSHLGMPLVNEVVIGLKDKDLFSAVSPISTSAVAAYVTNPTLPAIIEILYGAANPKVLAPTVIRTDLVGAFATGLTLNSLNADGTTYTPLNLNQTTAYAAGGNPGPTGNTLPTGVFEYLRLNTGVAATSPMTFTAESALPSAIHGLGAVGCLVNDTTAGATVRALNLNTTGTAANTSCNPVGFPNGRRPSDDVLDIALRVVMGALFNSDTDAPARDIPFTDANYNGPEQFTDTFPYLRTPLAGNVNPNVDPDDIGQK